MPALEDIVIIEYEDKYADEAVAMWRASKENALGAKDRHSLEHHLDFVRTRLISENEIYLAIHEPSNSVVGLMAIDDTELNQLYIHVDFQRLGIGTRLLNLAKQLSGGKLRLYTFEINTRAQRFYAKHGFTVIGHGQDNEENLRDLRYQWIASAGS